MTARLGDSIVASASSFKIRVGRQPKPAFSKIGDYEKTPAQRAATSDQALAALLNRLKATIDPTEIRQLSAQIERIFHKQFTNA